MKCEQCGKAYSFRGGIYDVISPNRLASQEKPDIKRAIQRKLTYVIKQLFIKKFERNYISKLSDDTREILRRQMEFMSKIYASFSGVVCDFPTGIGRNLKMLLDSKATNMTIVCTDLDKQMLSLARKHKGGKNLDVHYIVTDGRYMSVKDNTFDYIASIGAFGNVPETEKTVRELYRILKPQGKIVMNGSYIEKGSKSYDLAKSKGLERGMLEEYLVEELTNAGFVNITSTITGKAVWAENPYDTLPIAGDMQYFCIVQAEKI